MTVPVQGRNHDFGRFDSGRCYMVTHNEKMWFWRPEHPFCSGQYPGDTSVPSGHSSKGNVIQSLLYRVICLLCVLVFCCSSSVVHVCVVFACVYVRACVCAHRQRPRQDGGCLSLPLSFLLPLKRVSH